MMTRGEDGTARVGVRHDLLLRLRRGYTLTSTYRPGEVDVVVGEVVWLVSGDEHRRAVVTDVCQAFCPLERERVTYLVMEG